MLPHPLFKLNKSWLEIPLDRSAKRYIGSYFISLNKLNQTGIKIKKKNTKFIHFVQLKKIQYQTTKVKKPAEVHRSVQGH